MTLKLEKNIHIFVIAHIFTLALSNYLVQFPFTIWGYHLTLGAITFPFIFIITDIAVLTFGQAQARLVAYNTMLPALVISYMLCALFKDGCYQGCSNLLQYNPLAIRIAFSSCITYTVGQILDILVFQKIRNYTSLNWAPAIATTVSNLVDTYLFFGCAFYKCSDPILSNHWPEIATIEFIFKSLVNIICFMPVYLSILKHMGLTNNYAK